MTQPQTFLLEPGEKSGRTPDLGAAVRLICKIQRPSGAIPWFADGIWDAWNHVESAMALEAAGELDAADRAFAYLKQTQKPDGSWLGDYGNTAPMADRLHMSRQTGGQFHDTNFVAYCATGIWHRYVSRGDKQDLFRFWPMVSRALGFVLALQSEFGDVAWSSEAKLFGPDDSVLAGNASIRKSLESGIRIATTLGKMKTARTYAQAMARIDNAIKNHRERFDRNATDRSVYAMDWYYPTMSGCLKGHPANLHIRKSWNQYFVDGLGCRCVSTEPWITVAESAELAIALTGLGGHDVARQILKFQLKHRDEDGTFWMGYQFDEKIFWPREKPSWTQAAVILAFEALRAGSPTNRVLCQHA